MSVKKQFIAGAVCPACSAMDTIRMWDEDGTPHRDCVACGFADTLNAAGQSVPLEPGTRVTPKPASPPPAGGQALQFFPNPKLKK